MASRRRRTQYISRRRGWQAAELTPAIHCCGVRCIIHTPTGDAVRTFSAVRAGNDSHVLPITMCRSRTNVAMLVIAPYLMIGAGTTVRPPLGGVLRHGHDLLRRSSKSTEDTHGGVWSRPTRSTSPVTMTPVVVARQADHVVVAGISSRARSGRRARWTTAVLPRVATDSSAASRGIRLQSLGQSEEVTRVRLGRRSAVSCMPPKRVLLHADIWISAAISAEPPRRIAPPSSKAEPAALCWRTWRASRA